MFNSSVNILNSKSGQFVGLDFFFLLSVVFIHFDPFGIKITFPFIFLLFFIFYFRPNRITLNYLFYSIFILFISIFNFYIIKDVLIIDFLKMIPFKKNFFTIFVNCASYKPNFVVIKLKLSS